MGLESIADANKRADAAANLPIQVAQCTTFGELLDLLEDAVVQNHDLDLTITYDDNRTRLYKVRAEIIKLRSAYTDLKEKVGSQTSSGDPNYIENALSFIPGYARKLLRKELGLGSQDSRNLPDRKSAPALVNHSKKEFSQGQEMAMIRDLLSVVDWDTFLELLKECTHVSEFTFSAVMREVKPDTGEVFEVNKTYRSHELYSNLVALEAAFHISLQNLVNNNQNSSGEIQNLVEEWADRVPRKWRALFVKKYLT